MVTARSIRERILKVVCALSVQALREGYSPLDPREDTERRRRRAGSSSRGTVTARSIRERILKALDWAQQYTYDLGYSPLDPREDTESVIRRARDDVALGLQPARSERGY